MNTDPSHLSLQLIDSQRKANLSHHHQESRHKKCKENDVLQNRDSENSKPNPRKVPQSNHSIISMITKSVESRKKKIPPSFHTLYYMGLESYKMKQTERESVMKKKAEEEMEGCTFRPTLSSQVVPENYGVE